jgi:hypothetical protein
MSKDIFDYADDDEYEDEGQSYQNRGGLVWNLLTIFVLLTAICIGGYYFLIFFNPQSGLNPFPPPPMPELISTQSVPTSTNTPKPILPPTWTPTPVSTATKTPTPEPTYTLQPGEDPPTPMTRVPGEGMPFVMQEGNPQYIPNIYHPDAGCNWLGVGGQVIGLNGGPVLYLSIQLGGTLNGEAVDLITISGTAPQYGQAGYEFKLAEAPVDSTQSLYVQLLDQADLPLSEKLYFDTFNNCDQNLILINFTQIR